MGSPENSPYLSVSGMIGTAQSFAGWTDDGPLWNHCSGFILVGFGLQVWPSFLNTFCKSFSPERHRWIRILFFSVPFLLACQLSYALTDCVCFLTTLSRYRFVFVVVFPPFGEFLGRFFLLSSCFFFPVVLFAFLFRAYLSDVRLFNSTVGVFASQSLFIFHLSTIGTETESAQSRQRRVRTTGCVSLCCAATNCKMKKQLYCCCHKRLPATRHYFYFSDYFLFYAI